MHACNLMSFPSFGAKNILFHILFPHFLNFPTESSADAYRVGYAFNAAWAAARRAMGTRKGEQLT